MPGFLMQDMRKERLLKGKAANKQMQEISAFQKSRICSFSSSFSEQPVLQALLTCAMLLMTCGSILRGNFKILNKDRETKAFSASRIFFSSTETYTANVVSATWKPEREFTARCLVYSGILKAISPDRHLGNKSTNHKTGKIPWFWPFQHALKMSGPMDKQVQKKGTQNKRPVRVLVATFSWTKSFKRWTTGAG